MERGFIENGSWLGVWSRFIKSCGQSASHMEFQPTFCLQHCSNSPSLLAQNAMYAV